MRQCTVSVIIPAFNRVGFLNAAMQTIHAQNTPGIEILLVDDGSTDGLEAAARQHRHELHYIRQEHRGQSAARNLGLREARGEFIAFLDIDDSWAPGHLGRSMDALSVEPDAGIAQGLIRQQIESPDGSSWRSPAYRMPYLGSCVFRRWVFGRCGLFDETMAFGEDYDFLFRCWENDVPKVHVHCVSLFYRRHAGNLTAGRNRSAHLLVLKRRIERIKAGIIDPAAPRRTSFQTYIGDLTGAKSELGAAAWIN